MRTRAIVAICALFAFVYTSAVAETRTWTSKKGATVTARFTRIDGSQVILQKADGSFVSIDQAALSPGDQIYTQAGKTPRTSPPPSINGAAAKTLAQPVRLPTRSVLEDQDLDRDAWGAQQLNSRGLRVPLQQDSGANANAWLQENQVNQQPLERRRQQELWPADDIGANRQSIGSTSLSDTGRKATDDWTARQKQMDAWAAEQKQREREREADRLKSKAFELEGRISGARNKSDPDYRGMAFDAESLARDSDRLGNRSASWNFDNAASDLRKIERERNDTWRSSSSFGSDLDSKRRSAETDVWSGRGSLNRFDTKSTGTDW